MPASPSGLNSTSAMNTSPYQKSHVSVYAPSRSRARMKNAAPISGPQKLTKPPPTSTIITTRPDWCRLITFGYADCCAIANSAPANPAIDEATTKIENLSRHTG